MGALIIPVFNKKEFTMPLPPNILIHAKLRITEFVISGKMETASRIPLHFLLHKLIKYAVGTPKIPHTTVVIAAILNVLKNIPR